MTWSIERRRPRAGRALIVLGLVASLLAPVVAIAPGAAAGSTTTVGGCRLSPADSYWRADVSDLPRHPRSDAWVAAIGADRGLKADFGSGLWAGGPIGIPYDTVDGDQPAVPISFAYDDESDPGPYPIAPDAPIEGGPNATGDRHVLTVETDTCTLYEVYDAHPHGGGTSWTAGSGAVFDLTSNRLRPAGWTSADAAGLPILPGLVRYDEAASGTIDHAIRFTAPVTQRAFRWPARHFASSSTDPDVPPMGAWFRLKADVDLSGYSGVARAILEAARTHGLILADNGSPWFISGAPDERWDNDALRALVAVHGDDFEAVDTSGLIVDADSGQIQPPYGGLPPHGLVDVPPWIEEAVRWIIAEGHASGWRDHTYRPDLAVTRGQLARMLHRLAGSPDVGDAAFDHPFTDVPPWVDGPVRWLTHDPDGDGPALAAATGWADRTFRPDAPVTRAAATRILYRLAGSPSGAPDHGLVDVPRWIDDAVRWIVDAGHASGWADGTYRPALPLSRAQVTRMLFRMHG